MSMKVSKSFMISPELALEIKRFMKDKNFTSDSYAIETLISDGLKKNGFKVVESSA